MAEVPSEFFNQVYQKTVETGLCTNFSQDERDIVDDYEMQEFGVAACIEHIKKRRDYLINFTNKGTT